MNRRKRTPRNQKFSKASKRCEICGESKAVDNHHIIHKSEGGSDYGLNRVWLCPNHHRMVHNGYLLINGWDDYGYKLKLNYEFREEICQK